MLKSLIDNFPKVSMKEVTFKKPAPNSAKHSSNKILSCTQYKINVGLIFIGGIQQHDVAQRHQQHLLGVGSDPARVFSFLVGPNNTN
jgi:hypothetical protein